MCYSEAAIFITNVLCGIKVVRTLHNETSEAEKVPEAK
jgi:hypothetical protein